MDELEAFALLPVTPGFTVQCKVTRRRKKGIDRFNHSSYFYMHIERENNKKVKFSSK